LAGGAEGNLGASWSCSEGRDLPHHLITRREPTGFEVPHAFFRSGDGIVPVF
jgi:hypothetical protein